MVVGVRDRERAHIPGKTMKSTDTITNTTTETCNALLRGELSAIETYTQAIEKFAGNSGDYPLERIRADHQASAASLREIIGECGDEPATSSGPWGTFATAVEGVATLFGESPALITLQHGEIHGISEYEEALDDDDLDESVKDLIRGELLPALRDHLVELEYCKSKA